MLIVPRVYEQTPQGERAFDIFSRLLQDRIVLISDFLDDEMANLIIAQLLFLEAEDPDKDIYLYINSPGGGVTSTMAVYDTMNFIRSDVSTICTGLAGASAALLLAAGAKGKRLCLPNAKILLHQVYGQAEGPAQDIQIIAREIERLRETVNSLLVKHTGKPLRTILHDTERDFYLDAREALDYGLADQVIERHPRKPEGKQ
ncbi:MAG: ATP-dependent Clp protease proteolytic subunit [Candidatus Glassbacteria bacterium]|nr:ATP-dependent Clp protease proteolytic subunit [Candidatus Glassbacteria bacterium]